MRGDSEALLQAVRFLGMWDAIAVWECEGRSLFWDVGRAIAVWGMWGCDSASTDLSVRCLGCGRAISFWGCGECARFLGCGSAIAKRCCKQFAFGDVGVRSLLGCGRAIAKRCCKQFAVLGMWGCDSASAAASSSLLGCGRAIAKRSVGIAFWGCGESDHIFRV